jgi:hypothetical protein
MSASLMVAAAGAICRFFAGNCEGRSTTLTTDPNTLNCRWRRRRRRRRQRIRPLSDLRTPAAAVVYLLKWLQAVKAVACAYLSMLETIILPLRRIHRRHKCPRDRRISHTYNVHVGNAGSSFVRAVVALKNAARFGFPPPDVLMTRTLPEKLARSMRALEPVMQR